MRGNQNAILPASMLYWLKIQASVFSWCRVFGEIWSGWLFHYSFLCKKSKLFSYLIQSGWMWSPLRSLPNAFSSEASLSHGGAHQSPQPSARLSLSHFQITHTAITHCHLLASYFLPWLIECQLLPQNLPTSHLAAAWIWELQKWRETPLWCSDGTPALQVWMRLVFWPHNCFNNKHVQLRDEM